MKPLSTAPSLTEQAYRAILDEICDGNLPAGTHLVQEQIAAGLGVSRQPVQQALALLKADGMIEDTGKRGLRVTRLDLGLMREHYDIRAVLDGLAARRAAEIIRSSGPIAGLERRGKAILADGRLAVAAGSIGEMVRHDEAFHALIYEASGNALLPRTADAHWRFLRRVMGDVLRQAEPPRDVWQQHEDILMAILNAKPDQAERLAIEHVELAASALADSLSNPDGEQSPLAKG